MLAFGTFLLMEREIAFMEPKDINRGMSAKAIAQRTKRIQRHEKRFYEKYAKTMDPNRLALMKKLPRLMSEAKPRYMGTKTEIAIPKISGTGTEVMDYLDNVERIRINGNASFKEASIRFLTGSDFEKGSLAAMVSSTWKKSKAFYTKPHDYGADELKYWINIYLF